MRSHVDPSMTGVLSVTPSSHGDSLRRDTRMSRLVEIARPLVVLIALASTAGCSHTAAAQQADCSDYSSQDAAQFALDVNPSLASSLDPDGNGRACDDDTTSGPTETSVPDRTGADLQLPTEDAETPRVPTSSTATVDVVDQQPVNLNPLPTSPDPSSSQPPSIGLLDGRLGSDLTAFNTAHGAPTSEKSSDTNDAIATGGYPPPNTASELAVLYFNDQAATITVTAETSWSGTEAADVIREFLPADVTQLPQNSEILSDGSVLIPIFSEDLALGVTAATMSGARVSGVPGDMYMRLSTDGGERATEIEIGIGDGDGDNVREDINVQTGADPTPVEGTTNDAAPTPEPTTAVGPADAIAFLQNFRAETDHRSVIIMS